MTRYVALLSAALPLLASVPSALADDTTAPPPRNAHFPTMGPDGDGSQIGAQAGRVGGFESSELTADGMSRFDLRAQLVATSGGGGYINVAATTTGGDGHIGPVELGALYHLRGVGTDVVLRGGVVLPSGDAENEADFFASYTHLLSTELSRPSDLLAGVPSTTTLRLAVSPSFRQGDLVVRADAGVDIVVDTDATEPDAPFVHLDLGAGYHNGKGGVLVELSNLAYLEDGDDTLHLVAVTGEAELGRATGYLTVSRPFADSFPDDTDITNVLVGVRTRL